MSKNRKKIHIIIQARLESKRLPNKILKIINKKTILKTLLDRLKYSKLTEKIIIAIPKNSKNKFLKSYIIKNKFKNIYEGSSENVLSRYYGAAKKFSSDIIVRITSDCPLIDPKILDQMISKFLNSNFDYLSNTLNPTYPDGYDIEIFNFKTLKETFLKAKKSIDKEHVTSYIKRNKIKFKVENFSHLRNLSNLRLTIDEEIDYELISRLTKLMKNKNFFGLRDVENIYKKNPKFFNLNSHLIRNEGFSLNKGQKLWKRAQQIIPNGNMLLSKNPNRFFNLNNWPVYFKKTKGCEVWDLDNKKFYDFSFMGIGTNILGYNNNYVDSAVKKTIKNGNLSTLNCPEEVELAEKLIEMHPWAHMVHFARSGGEANAIAIRIARAAVNKDKIVVCGYHGWHDWYLAANLNNKNNLDTHLFPHLNHKGVPKNLKNTVYTFNYNDFNKLSEIIAKDKQIGIIKMEVQRDMEPKNNFLKKVRKLASENGIILIFDECTSGFRETFGGLHLKYNVIPDIAMFGKALGNGYAITAVVGKKEFMKHANKTFVSSTFWTERIGPTAGIATLDEMKKLKAWDQISTAGKYIKKRINKIALKNQIKIEFYGLDSLINFKFKNKNNDLFIKFITFEMLKKGFLAKNSLYVSTSHTKVLIENYLYHLSEIFTKL
ncbi:aminotransferase class III-fold pyridoxal phosphate-dependent enzyme, partial [Candidatus Pelagibacter sp.]|nr:aminotransferase class III-fold pyridoxal phosphate-dependent enzyme [Candidatus Pelagibacter sp.]